jgi:hypothetical protein
MRAQQAPPGLAGFVADVAASRERIVFSLEDGTRAALVPVEDLDALEAMEDREDIADAARAMTEPGSVPWEQVKADLGL